MVSRAGVKRSALLVLAYLIVATAADLPPFQDRPRYWRELMARQRQHTDYLGIRPDEHYSCIPDHVQAMWITFVDDGWAAEAAWVDPDGTARKMRLPFIDREVFGTEVYATGLYRLTLDPIVRFVSPAGHIGPC